MEPRVRRRRTVLSALKIEYHQAEDLAQQQPTEAALATENAADDDGDGH